MSGRKFTYSSKDRALYAAGSSASAGGSSVDPAGSAGSPPDASAAGSPHGVPKGFRKRTKIAADRTRKLQLTKDEYKEVLQAQKDDYESDLYEEDAEEDALASIFDQIARQLKLPVPRPRSRSKSNYIMNLMETLFAHFGPQVGVGSKRKPKYSMEQEVIALIWKVDQAEISEIGLTKLCEGYIHNGGGFSHFPAGLSNDSAHRLRPKVWAAAQEWMLKYSCYPVNMRAQLDALHVTLAEAQKCNAKLAQQTAEYGRQDIELQVLNLINDMCKKNTYLATLKSKGDDMPLAKKIQDLVKEIEAVIPSPELDQDRITNSEEMLSQLSSCYKQIFELRAVAQAMAAILEPDEDDDSDYFDSDDDVDLDTVISRMGDGIPSIEDLQEGDDTMEEGIVEEAGDDTMDVDMGMDEDGRAESRDDGESGSDEDDDVERMLASLEKQMDKMQASFALPVRGNNISQALNTQPAPLSKQAMDMAALGASLKK